MPENMKCPFRIGADGEFCSCCGKDCMAYYEFERPQYDPSVNTVTNMCRPRTVSIPMCKRMPMPITYNCCV